MVRAEHVLPLTTGLPASGRLTRVGVFAGVELGDLVLSGPRLTLRPWRPEDADAVLEHMQDQHLHVFLNLPRPYTSEDARSYVAGPGNEGRADGTGIGCAMIESSTGRLVGSIALRLPQRHSAAAEIGYWVGAIGRGHGYAAEASRTLTDWAFAHGVGRVQIRCAVRNLASARAALRAGFRFEAILPAEGPSPAGPVDHAVFGRLAREPGGPVPPVFAPLPAGGLADGVLALRIGQPGDATALAEQERDPVSVATGLGLAVDAAAVAERARRAELEWWVGPTGNLAMVDVATGGFAGSLQLRLPGPPGVLDLGYTVHPAFRGRGYTARALRLVTGWAFDAAGFDRIELGAKADNVASQKAALAGGFLPDGVRAARLRNPDGTYSDEHCFCLTKAAWQGDREDRPVRSSR
jgi:RimJ/RimL family protein N-acetyltransferase